MTDITVGLRAMAEGFEEEGHELLASVSMKAAERKLVEFKEAQEKKDD